MKYLNLILILLSFNCLAGKIAITFDDAPMRNMSMYSGLERTKKLIEVFDKKKIKVAFFSNPSKFKKNDGLYRMKLYDKAGHFITNHTFTHPSLNKITAKAYEKNIEKSHMLLKDFINFKPWFRYPFLHHGDTKKKRDKIRRYLKTRGYSHGFVTVDNQDWFMASLIDNHIRGGGKINKEKLCHAYSEMLWDSIKYFDDVALKYLKRSPLHTLLLHENDLAPLCVGRLIRKIESMGWEIISPELALTDEIYSKRPDTLFNGNGQIGALVEEAEGVQVSDPWSNPWNNGKKIREEFQKRGIFQ